MRIDRHPYQQGNRSGLKELRHDILSHFVDGLSHGLSVGKPKLMAC